MKALRRLIPRFSLRTLAIFLLLVTSGMGLWWHWGPWVKVRELTGHKAAFYHASFSPDGSLLCTTSHDGTARIWNGTTGEPVKVLQGGWQGGGLARFSCDGRWLAVAADTAVHVWRVGTWRRIRSLEHAGEVGWLSFSPDGEKLVCAYRSQKAWRARVWGAATGEVVTDIHENLPFGIAVFNRDGTEVMAFSLGMGGRRYDAVDGTLKGTCTREEMAQEMAHSPDLPDEVSRDAYARIAFGIWGDAMGPNGSYGAGPKSHGGSTVVLYRLSRPARWWGVFWLWEFWLAAAFAALLAWSIVRDRRAFARRSSAG